MSQQTVLPTAFPPLEACPANHPPAPGPADNNDRCQFSFADGRSCRMLRWHKHRLYCLPHAREEERLLAVDQVGCELASLSGEFNTVSDINHVLGKVFTLLAHNRISRRDAIAYAYVGQLLLQTIPTVKDEVCEVLGRHAWKEKLQDALCDPPDPPAAVARVVPPPAGDPRPCPAVALRPETRAEPSAPASGPKTAAPAKKRRRAQPGPEPRETYYTDEWGARYRVTPSS